jgi:hypothetical protein
MGVLKNTFNWLINAAKLFGISSTARMDITNQRLLTKLTEVELILSSES